MLRRTCQTTTLLSWLLKGDDDVQNRYRHDSTVRDSQNTTNNAADIVKRDKGACDRLDSIWRDGANDSARFLSLTGDFAVPQERKVITNYDRLGYLLAFVDNRRSRVLLEKQDIVDENRSLVDLLSDDECSMTCNGVGIMPKPTTKLGRSLS